MKFVMVSVEYDDEFSYILCRSVEEAKAAALEDMKSFIEDQTFDGNLDSAEQRALELFAEQDMEGLRHALAEDHNFYVNFLNVQVGEWCGMSDGSLASVND